MHLYWGHHKEDHSLMGVRSGQLGVGSHPCVMAQIWSEAL